MADATADLPTTMPGNYQAGRVQADADLTRYRWDARTAADAQRNARLLAEDGTDDLRANMLGYADRLAEVLAAQTRGPAPDLIIVDDEVGT